MKSTIFVLFYGGVLLTLDNTMPTFASEKREEKWKSGGVKEEVSPPHSSFPLLTLPSFSSFSLPALNFPYLQAFSQANRISSPKRVSATKTEYVEVTRRQTVHPVCYTAHETKAPCLPYAQSDFQEDDYDNPEFEAFHQTHDNLSLNEIKKAIKSTPTSQITTTKGFDLAKGPNSEQNARAGKYLEFALKRSGPAETSSRIEASEFLPTLNRVPVHSQATEYHTKTVLITKLEKYTDRRVTATLLAVNCLPVDRSIPMCQNYPSSVREAPDRRSDGNINFQANSYNPTLTTSGNLESEVPPEETNQKSVPVYQ